MSVVPDEDEPDSTQEFVASMTDFFEGDSGRLTRDTLGGMCGLSIWTVTVAVDIES